jgi:hypothetical protein
MTMQQDSIDPRLRDALAATADADRTRGASAAVEQRLRAALRAQRAARERRRQIVWVAAAAAIVIGVTTIRWHTTVPDVPPAAAPVTSATDAVPAEFIPLRYASVPARNGQIVHIVVPASALASFGLEPASVGGDAVNAEVFVGEDGLARAVRFSPFSTKEIAQ